MKKLRLPPLQLLTAFEATARHLSFKKAAEELCVTASAVSQQIKQLESAIDSQLFIRTTRNVRLTDAGTHFYALSSNILHNYQQEFSRFSRTIATPSLRLGTSAHIAYDIIIPSLHSIANQNAPFDLRIDTSEVIADFEEEQYACAIRIGEGDWPGLSSRLLRPMSVTIAGSPSFIMSNSIEALGDIMAMPLIHARTHINDWEAVSEALNMDLSKNKQIYLDNYLAAVGAAEQGLGLIVAMLPVTNARFKENSLAPIVDISMPIEGRGFYFVQRDEAEPSAYIEDIYQWVKQLFDDL